MKKAIVTAGTISVRTGRAVTYSQLGTFGRGDQIIVLDDGLDKDYAKVIWRVGYAYSSKGAHIGWLSNRAAAPAVNAVVKANTISVRKGRGQNYTRLGKYHNADQLIVLDDQLNQDYAKVIWQVGYAYSKYGKYIRFEDEPAVPSPSPEPNAVVTAGRISVRKGRSQSYAKLGEFKNGDKITVLDDTLDEVYAHVVWKDRDGYAYSNKGAYIRLTEEEPGTPSAPEPPPVSQPSETNAVVTAGRISVRKGRSQSYAKLGEFKNGDKITVLDEKLDETYAHVVWKDRDGYAYSNKGEHIRLTDTPPVTPPVTPPSPEPPQPAKPNAVVTANRISVRTARTQSADKLGEFKSDDKITVLDDKLDQTYAHVVWKDRDGYAYSSKGEHIRFLDSKPQEPVPNKVKRAVDVLATCTGGKYIFGAQGHRITQDYVKSRQKSYPSYFSNGRYEFLLDIAKRCEASNTWRFPDDYAWDCSGLWWYAANLSGIYGKKLDTTANTFYRSYCVPIKKSELRAGDAVFYKDSSGRVVHMGVVGQNGVIHEAMSGYTGVVLGSSVDDRSAPRIVGSGTYRRSSWNLFGRPKIFL